MHTKTPWELQSRSVSDNALVIKDAAYNEICCLAEKADRHYGDADKFKQQLGEHIVKCVNSHDELVAALENVVKTWEGPRELAAVRFAQNIDAARAALALARGK